MSQSTAMVSVIVPCLDQGHYLHDAFESISSASTSKDAVEVLVVAHGANESNTKRIGSEVESFRRDGHNFKMIGSDVAGAAAARNAGARAGSGDYLIFLNADGLLSPGTIDVRLGRLLERSADLVVTNYLFYDEQQSYLWSPEPTTISQDLLDFRSVSRCWRRGVSIPLSAGLFRRELVLRNPFDEDLEGAEEWLFWMRLLASTDKAEYLPTIGCVQRNCANASEREMALAAAWVDATMKAARDIPQFGEAERKLALQYTEEVHFEYFRQAFRSTLPERFYGALFGNLGTTSGE